MNWKSAISYVSKGTLAVAAEEKGKRTLILDMDPQGTATAWFKDHEGAAAGRYQSRASSRLLFERRCPDVDPFD